MKESWSKKFDMEFAVLSVGSWSGKKHVVSLDLIEKEKIKGFIKTGIIEKLIQDAINAPHNEVLMKEELENKWLGLKPGDVIYVNPDDRYGKLPSNYDGTWNPNFPEIEPYCKGCNRQEEHCICGMEFNPETNEWTLTIPPK